MRVPLLAAAAVVALVATTTAPAAAAPGGPVPVVAAPGVGGAAPRAGAPTPAVSASGVGASPAPVPCPKAQAPKVRRSPRPTPPPSVPEDQVIGGAELATSGLVVPADAPAPPAVTATSWLVADLDTGVVLGGCGPHEYATPASVQKLLLAVTALPRLDPKQVVTVTREDLNIAPGSSAVGLVEGGRYTVETVFLGLLLQSGNEAANVLARLIGGADGAAGGVRAMNEQARYLGARQTHAVTPSGLDGPGQFTSAYDLALIARACFANPTFRRYALTRRTRIPAQPAVHAKGFEIQNENQLIYHYPGALGGKTGFTDYARHTYVGAAERDGRRLVVTLLGAEPRPKRGWEQGAALLDWGFSLPRDAFVGRLVEPGETEADASEASASASAPQEPWPVSANRDVAGKRAGWPLVAVALAAVALVGLVALLLRRRQGRP